MPACRLLGLSTVDLDAGSIRKLPQLRFLPGALDNCFFQQCSLFRQCRLFLPQSRQVGSSSASPFTQCHTTPAQCLQRGYVVFRLGNVHVSAPCSRCSRSALPPAAHTDSPATSSVSCICCGSTAAGGVPVGISTFSVVRAFQRHGKALPRKKLSLLLPPAFRCVTAGRPIPLGSQCQPLPLHSFRQPAGFHQSMPAHQ